MPRRRYILIMEITFNAYCVSSQGRIRALPSFISYLYMVGGGRKGKESHSLLSGIVHLHIKNDSVLSGPSVRPSVRKSKSKTIVLN
jgi:hypothetical protein